MVSALAKDTPESSLTPLPGEGTARERLSMNQDGSSHQTESAGAELGDFQPSKL